MSGTKGMIVSRLGRLCVVVARIWMKTRGVVDSEICEFAAKFLCYLVFHVPDFEVVPN